MFKATKLAVEIYLMGHNSMIGEKGSLALLCVSLSVITTPGEHVPLRSLLMDPERAPTD